MLFSDTYRTISAEARGLCKDRGSRFIAFAIPVKSREEIKEKLAELRKEYHDARHHCYAWVLGPDRQTYRVSDDGEPSGTAGKPIIGQINALELTDILVVVVRYFGGTLLGVSGLISAYRTAAADALSAAEIIDKTVMQRWMLTFPWQSMNDVMKVLKETGCEQHSHEYGAGCRIEISARATLSTRIVERLEKIEGLKAEFTGTR